MLNMIRGDTIYCQAVDGEFFFKGNRIVRNPVADSDGDIQVYCDNGNDWFYVPLKCIDSHFSNGFKSAPPPTGKTTDLGEAFCQAFAELPAQAAIIDTLSITEQLQKELPMANSVGCTNSQRRTLNLVLIDDDAGLEDEDSIVGSYTCITSDSDSVAINQLVSEGKVTRDIDKHNKKRVEIVNKDILNRTGNTANLLPIKLKDLRFEVK